MRLNFVKMHGLGNDFVVVDLVRQQAEIGPEEARLLANRRLGVGCDQVLLVEPPTRPDAAFRYRIFNADGNEVEQCGNGARCLARFVRDEGLTDLDEIPVETAAGLILLRVRDDGQVTVDMGAPRLDPAEIPFETPQTAPSYPLEVDGETVEIGAVSMGNPHAVLIVTDIQAAPVARLGPAIEDHPRFPRRVNVGFMEIVAPGTIRLRVYERGTGETMACGTGACAAVVIGRLQGHLEETVNVDLPGGRLVISWPGEGGPVLMTGPAARVFTGTIEL